MPHLDVRTKAYPVEERLKIVWVWIGDMDPVPVEEDIPIAMKVPGAVNFVHFTNVWNTNWALLFDNFMDGLHAPYVHRTSPQFIWRKLPYRSGDGRPHFEFTEHDGKVLEAVHGGTSGRRSLIDQMEFSGLGKFPRVKWWRAYEYFVILRRTDGFSRNCGDS